MTIEAAGIELFEQAFAKLWGLSAVRSRWDRNELWGILAERIVNASQSSDPPKAIEHIVQSFTKAGPSLVAFSVANVIWRGQPIAFPFGVIGILSDELISAVNARAKRGAEMRGTALENWIKWQGEKSEQLADSVAPVQGANAKPESITQPCGASFGSGGTPPPPPVIWVTWVPGQLDLAFRQAQREFENLAGITLLLEGDLKSHGISMVGDPSNRIGVRGSTLDRRAVESLLSSSGHVELVTTPLTMSDAVASSVHYWGSAKPLPLADLLAQPTLRANVVECMSVKNPITARIKVAARWYSEALWATQKDDAALALGVALDSLVGSRSGLPGREMRERYAFLDSDATRRPQRSTRYQELFSVRSSIAHGGASSHLDEQDFVNLMASDVTWAAHRLLALYRAFKPSNEAALDKTFDGLRWGTLEWPDAPDSSADS